ncbi:uncharacterized protein BXIN_1041 [Babesia sp. Xinjiang]|uniref:uncharacterized protein n=1 Tax=Babesia sp. Xinjiang TaxID=462227 RepID=UPI000A22C7F8|nr:uncharacterized protein BXIN_1041 [Babesia sp. Xinjiang]ORM41998.1 hypothetical protein BXIN_1041 [Babesia sp. Xinjiang]
MVHTMQTISNIQWGCLWQDWNFFPGDVITEVDTQHLAQRLSEFGEQEIDDLIRSLRNACYKFTDQVNTYKQKYYEGEMQAVDIVTQLLSIYTNDVLEPLTRCYSVIRNRIYMDIKHLGNKRFPQMIADILESGYSDDNVTGSDRPKPTVQFRDAAELLQQRVELLPKHKSDATDLSTLTSLDDIIGKSLMDHPGLSGEPFFASFTSTKLLDVSSTQLKLTSTAMDLYKKCFEGYKKGIFTVEKSKSAKSLVVLNILVTLIKNHEKQFTKGRNFRGFLGISNQ